MHALMPRDTIYITIVRDPVSLFESMFDYYKLKNFWNFTLDKFNEPNFEMPKRVLTDRYVGKIGWNQMMFDLGMNVEDFVRPEIVERYIEKLDSTFNLVMAAERMDESLILLKHLLCWKTDDLVVFKVMHVLDNITPFFAN